MIRVCYYKGCGVVYGAIKPLSDKRTTHGLCPKHLKIYLKEIKAEMERYSSGENQPQHTVFSMKTYSDHLV